MRETMSELRTTKQYDRTTENTELLDRIEVIDAETHTTENADDIVPLLDDPELRKMEETGYVLENSADSAYGVIPWNFYNHRSGGERGGLPLLTTPLKTVEDLRSQADDIRADTVLVNSLNALNTCEIANTRKQVAYLRAANRYQVEQIGADGEDFHVPVTINPDHPEESIEELEKYADRDHVSYVMAPTGTEHPLGNKRYGALLDAIDRTGLPLMTHGLATSRDRFPGPGLEMDSYFEHRTLGQVLGHVRDIVSLIGQEVPERYDIDFCFVEHAFSAVPFLMGRMDREFRIRGFEAPGLTGPPSDYLSEFYYGTQPMPEYRDEGFLRDMIERLDLEDQIVYTSDYPHPDGDHPGAIADHPALTETQKVKILQDNARELFGL